MEGRIPWSRYQPWKRGHRCKISWICWLTGCGGYRKGNRWSFWRLLICENGEMMDPRWPMWAHDGSCWVYLYGSSKDLIIGLKGFLEILLRREEKRKEHGNWYNKKWQACNKKRQAITLTSSQGRKWTGEGSSIEIQRSMHLERNKRWRVTVLGIFNNH